MVEIRAIESGDAYGNSMRVFFDYDCIELYDESHSRREERYDTIGDTSAENLIIIGNLQDVHRIDDILFVVYTERVIVDENGKSREVTRLYARGIRVSQSYAHYI